MITDALLSFLPVGGAPITITSAEYDTPPIDLSGSGVGTPPGGGNIIGNATLFGEDPGIGLWRPEFFVSVGTAFSGGTSLQIKYQAAVDTATTYQPGTWTTIAETPAILPANLGAGAVLARFPFLPDFPPGLNPRYLRLAIIPAGTFTAGTIACAPVTMGRDDYSEKYAARNYTVA